MPACLCTRQPVSSSVYYRIITVRATQECLPVIDQAGGFSRYHCDGLDIFYGDFFALDRNTAGDIDAVYDRASLIALPPAMRPAYATHLASLLDPGTYCLLITLDYEQWQMNGPPFAVTGEEITGLYADAFSIEPLSSEDVLDDNSRFRKAGITRLHECVYRLQRK